MFELLNLRKKHGRQAIPDIKKADLPENFRGFPLLEGNKCLDGCTACSAVCPTGAIEKNQLRLDMGKCIFCGECQITCDKGAIRFTHKHLLGATSRDGLIVTSGMSAETFAQTAIEARKEIHRLFGRSLKLRQVSAAGCNGCEMELAAAGNVNFDMGRFGIDFVASPRHADGLVITGPVSKNMAPALRDAFYSISEPRLVIAVGACAISGGLFMESAELNRSFFEELTVDLYIPGCPPHPLTIIRAFLKWLNR
jgi:Ni,Fe-hydrogenase III small subunit/ferredoxin